MIATTIYKEHSDIEVRQDVGAIQDRTYTCVTREYDDSFGTQRVYVEIYTDYVTEDMAYAEISRIDDFIRYCNMHRESAQGDSGKELVSYIDMRSLPGEPFGISVHASVEFSDGDADTRVAFMDAWQCHMHALCVLTTRFVALAGKHGVRGLHSAISGSIDSASVRELSSSTEVVRALRLDGGECAAKWCIDIDMCESGTPRERQSCIRTQAEMHLSGVPGVFACSTAIALRDIADNASIEIATDGSVIPQTLDDLVSLCCPEARDCADNYFEFIESAFVCAVAEVHRIAH